MEFSNSDLSDILSQTMNPAHKIFSNSSKSVKLTANVIANLALSEKDMHYLLSCKVVVKPLSIVRISCPWDDVSK